MFNFMYIFEISYLEFIKKLQFQKKTHPNIYDGIIFNMKFRYM